MSKLRMLKFVSFGACAVGAYPWWTELVWETFGKAPEIAHAVTLASLAVYVSVAVATAYAITLRLRTDNMCSAEGVVGSGS